MSVRKVSNAFCVSVRIKYADDVCVSKKFVLYRGQCTKEVHRRMNSAFTRNSSANRFSVRKKHANEDCVRKKFILYCGPRAIISYLDQRKNNADAIEVSVRKFSYAFGVCVRKKYANEESRTVYARNSCAIGVSVLKMFIR